MDLRNLPRVILLSSPMKYGNMSFVRGDLVQTLANRKRFLKGSGLKMNQIVAITSHHSGKVFVADKKDSGKGNSKATPIEADGIITNEKNLYLFLLTADCLPIALYDLTTKSIGLLHASRINIKSIIKETIKELQTNFGTKPAGVLAYIGPSIGPCHYDLNLWKIAQDELIESGIFKEHITTPKICSYESEDYYSHRRSLKEGSKDFRFATVFGIKAN